MSIVETLARASNNLLMMSESDYPFEPFVWEMQQACELTEKQLLQQIGYPETTRVELVAVDDFFLHACKQQEWHTDKEKITTNKFQDLVATLKSNLSQLQVFRVYKTASNIDVYIIGKTPTKNVAGLSTKLVET